MNHYKAGKNTPYLRKLSLPCCKGLKQGSGLGNQREVFISPSTLLYLSYYMENHCWHCRIHYILRLRFSQHCRGFRQKIRLISGWAWMLHPSKLLWTFQLSHLTGGTCTTSKERWN